MKQLIGLIDCNNFFVSCERVFRPDLEHKPVVVLSSNDGCVVARSQEVKDSGIAMGVPYFQVKDRLKEINATIFSSHHSLYRDISRRVFEIVKDELRDIEVYSIDECFFHIKNELNLGSINRVRQRVRNEIGIPVSIGIAESKTRAKYAIRLAKRTNSVKVLSEDEWQLLASEIPMHEIWGVGIRTTKKLASLGIKTVAEYSRLEDAFVAEFLGIEGQRLQAELKGKSVLLLQTSYLPRKSLMSTKSFSKATTSSRSLEAAISEHVHHLVKDLIAQDLLTRSIRVLIYPSRYGDFALQGSSVELSFVTPTNDIFLLKKAALDLFRSCYEESIPYKKAGVVLSGLVEPASMSGALFQENTNVDLTRILLEINKQHGKDLLTLGLLQAKNSVCLSRNDLMSPEYTTRWGQIKSVYAR